ncbi:MAG: hypothetical protein ACI9N9_001339 [Enterobacterales bacterium]|jgi:hypothetical protein
MDGVFTRPVRKAAIKNIRRYSDNYFFLLVQNEYKRDKKARWLVGLDTLIIQFKFLFA